MAGALVRALAGHVYLLSNPRVSLSVKKNLCLSVCCSPKADGVLKLKMWCPSFYMLTISVEMMLRLKVKRIWGKANHEGSLKVGQGNSTGLGPDPFTPLLLNNSAPALNPGIAPTIETARNPLWCFLCRLFLPRKKKS